MKIRVIGCYGSYYFGKKGGVCQHYNSSCFQINETTLIDAGTEIGPLQISEMAKIRTIFLSHAHLDHTRSLPFMAEGIFGMIKKPILIASTEEILDTLRKHLFNDHLWPDFTAIPSKSNPIFRYKTIKVGVPVKVDGLKITAVSVNHTVPTVGYLVEDGRSAIVYSGDTWKTDEIWERANRLKSLSASLIESSFPNRLDNLAFQSKHLTPRLTYEEFLKINRKEISLYTYHMKLPFLDELRNEIHQLREKNENIHLLKDGQILEF